MINDEKMVQEFAEKFKERIVKNCNFADALTVQKALIQRTVQLEGKIKEYSTRRDALLEKDKTLGNEVAALISDCKNPDVLSKKRREVKFEIDDLNAWVAESEKLLVTLQVDKSLADKRVFDVINVASGEEKVLIVDELNVDLKIIENKIEAYHAACWQLSTDYEIASVDRSVVLTNREVKHCLP